MERIVSANGLAIEVHAFQKALVGWGKNHFRPFPWRLMADTYRILIAEILMHRTQARQVVPVYNEFILLYPSISALAEADSDELRSMLYPPCLHHRAFQMRVMEIESEVDEDSAAGVVVPGVFRFVYG